MYETNTKTEYVDYGEIVSIINDKLVNINMGGQRDTNGQLVILEAVSIVGDYIAQVGDWVGVEWRSGVPVAIGGSNSNSSGLKNINDNVKIISQSDMAGGVINSEHVRTETIEARHIKVGSIQAQHVSANTIQAQHISANAITTAHLNVNIIDAQHIKANAIQAQHITANAIAANHITANAINAGHIVANAITSTKIAADSVNANHITANAIQAKHISANLIQAQHISAGSINSTHISANAIQAVHISANTINTGHIVAGAIQAVHISANTITGDKIAANSISGGNIVGDSIEAKHLTVSTREFGLLAQYFTHTNGTNKFEVFKGTRIEPVLDFDWVAGSPSIVGQSDNFSIRFQGMLFAPEAGTYTFYLTADNGAKLWVNDTVVVDGWSTPPNGQTGTIAITKDSWAIIRLEYYEGALNAKLKLEWKTPSGVREVIPSRYLSSTQTVIDGGTILTNTITASNIQVGTITAASGIIADAAIGTAHIISGNITSAKIANAAITSAHIASANILSAHIASANITDAHITTLNAGKINAGFIASERIAANSISGNQIAANTINGDRIIGNTIDANKIKAGSITANQIGAQAITANEIKAGSISGDKIRAQSITAEHISARGIDVANNIMVYNSVTGETLIGGGYLRVDGLDVGVVQSDNLIGNGLFLTASSAYGLLKDNPVGETMLGAKNNEIGAHQVWKYDLATGAFITAINIQGKKPVGVAIDEEDLYVYVTVQGDNTLAQIGVDNDGVTSTTLQMGHGPAEIKYFGLGLMDHKHFFILNTDEHDHRVPDSLIVVDAPPASINSDLYVHHEIPLGNTPYDMVLDDRRWMYVTQAGQGDIAVLDLSNHDSTTFRVIGSIPIAATGTDNYHGGLPSTFGLGFVTGGDSAGQYDATGADSSSGSEHHHGGYGSSTGSAKTYTPKGIAQSTDNDTLYVVDSANNELVVIDKFGKAPYNALTGRDESTGNMGDHSGHEGMPPAEEGGQSPADSRGNLANGGGPRTYWVRYRIPIGDNPDRVAVMNGKVFVTLQGSGQVAIIDEQDILDEIALDRAFYTPMWTPFAPMRPVNDIPVRTVTVGSRPTRMILNPIAGKMIISLTGQDRVVYFDATTETVTSTIVTGSNPMGLAMTNDGRFLYVANNGGGGDLSFIYPKGPYFGDPYVGLEGMVEYQGAEFWTPYRTDWVRDTSGNVIAASSVEFRVNEPFLNEGGYAALRVQGKRFQEAWIEQDIYNVENYSNGNNVIETLAEKLYNISGNQSKWYPQADWLLSPLPIFRQVQELSGGALNKTLISANAYVVDYDSPASVTMNTPIPSGNWVEADYTTRNNLWYKFHNGSVLIAQENSSSENFKTEFQMEEWVPKFVVIDNQQTSPFTPTADGIDEEYTGLEYSVYTNRAKGKTVTSSVAPTSGALSLITDGLQIDDVMGDHTAMDMYPVQPFVTLPAGLQHVKVDLGAIYMIGKITVAHSYEEDRVYQGTKTEVSEDGITWTTVYDSAVNGLYSEKPSYHTLHGHTHYAKVITFPAKPVRYVRDWANGYKVGGTGSLITDNHWTDIKVFGDWELEKDYVYDSGEFEGMQIATNGKGVVTTDIPKAFIAADIQIDFTSWWYMTYLVGPEFGTLAIEMPTIMNSNHFLSLTNEYVNKVAHRHIMSFPPSSRIVANEGAGIKAGKHRAVIRQESGKISLDRLRFEDFQFYKTNPLAINGASTSFQRYKIVAEQAKWYQGQGRQSTFGPYDTPRTNPDTGLPDNSVPIKYRFRVKSYLNSDNINEERGVAYITSAIVETGKQSTHWRPSAASDSIAASKLEAWDPNQPHKTGIQSHHIANGAIRGAKILPYAIMDYHISPYAKIDESKLRLSFPTHGHGRYVPITDPMSPLPFMFISNKDFLDSLEGFAGSGGTFGTGNTVARADHGHDYLGISGTATDSAMLGGQAASAYLRSNTTGTLTGGLTITSTLGVTGNTTLRGNTLVLGATNVAALTATSLTVSGNIVVTGTVDGIDIAALSTTTTGHIGSGGTAHALATASSNGFLSSADFSKLGLIQASAINQTTADGRYLRLTGGALTGNLTVNVPSGDGFINIQTAGADKGKIRANSTGVLVISSTGNSVVIRPLGDTNTGGEFAVSSTGMTYGGATVWHGGNLVIGNYYTKTQTDDLLVAAGNIKAEIANVFTHAGTAIKIQPSANVAANTKVFLVNDYLGAEKFSIDAEGDVTIKSNLTVEGTTQYAGTTVIQGDYTVEGNFGASGNSVLNTATINTLTIPSNGVIKQIGKEVEVMRFPVFGVAGDMQFQSDSTAFDKIMTQYNLFNTGYAMPAVPSGATRKYKYLVSYSTSTTNACTFRTVQAGTTTEIMSYALTNVNGLLDGTARTVLTPAFTTAYTGHVDLQAKSDTAGTLVIKYIEVIAYDVY